MARRPYASLTFQRVDGRGVTDFSAIVGHDGVSYASLIGGRLTVSGRLDADAAMARLARLGWERDDG